MKITDIDLPMSFEIKTDSREELNERMRQFLGDFWHLELPEIPATWEPGIRIKVLANIHTLEIGPFAKNNGDPV